MKPFQIYLAALIVLNLILSSYIVYSSSGTGTFCILGEGCSEVQNSEYGAIFGIPVSVFGILSFVFLFILYLYSHKSYQRYKIYLVPVIIGLLFSIYFLAIQFFVLKKICSTCIVVDTVMIAIAALSIYEFNRLRKNYNFI